MQAKKTCKSFLHFQNRIKFALVTRTVCREVGKIMTTFSTFQRRPLSSHENLQQTRLHLNFKVLLVHSKLRWGVRRVRILSTLTDTAEVLKPQVRMLTRRLDSPKEWKNSARLRNWNFLFGSHIEWIFWLCFNGLLKNRAFCSKMRKSCRFSEEYGTSHVN